MNVYALKAVSIFSGLDGDDLALLASHARTEAFEAGSPLIHQGDREAPLFAITAGRVKVFRTSASGLEVIIAVRGVGECLGELSVLDGAPRSASVAAVTDVEAIQIDRLAMRQAVSASPKLAWALLTALSLRLREASDTIEAMATKSLIERLAFVLISIGDQHGAAIDASDNAPVKLPAPLTTTDLAALVGNSREKVTKALTSLRAKSLVSRDPHDHGLILDDPASLRHLADGEMDLP
ncbi:MAG: Crp/Fnr family transcriptional regulator [Capsulimonadaceae bacterium]|nr:Crp/Fnr family transcriptional regulator [Capsulimonadaceae bacterium]